MRTIRASEIGTYIYCQRAWWYQQQGFQSENQAELSAGTALHEHHGQTVLLIGCLRIVAYALLLLAIGITAFYLTFQLL